MDVPHWPYWRKNSLGGTARRSDTRTGSTAPSTLGYMSPVEFRNAGLSL